MSCNARHWFSTDPPGVYSYCDMHERHEDGMHIDHYGRWWRVTTVDEMPAAQQAECKQRRYR